MHRREKNFPRRSFHASAECGGPRGRPAGRPYNAITWFAKKERLARPAQEMMRATPLLPDGATPEIQITLRLLDEK